MKLRRDTRVDIASMLRFHRSFVFLFSVTNDHTGIKDKFQLSFFESQRKRHRRETNKGKTDSASQLRGSGLRISGLRYLLGILNLTWMFQSYFVIIFRYYFCHTYILLYLKIILLFIMYYEF